MLKKTQRALQRGGIILLAAFIGIALLAGVGAYLLNESGETLIKQQAERKAVAWAEYIGATLPRIDEIANAGTLSNEELKFLDGIREFGDVFRFKLYNVKGQLSYLFDENGAQQENHSDLGQINYTATSVLSTKKAYSELKEGTTKTDRPEIYVEAYAPVIRNGNVIAVSEVYIDETAAAALIFEDFLYFGLTIAALVAFVVAIPLAAVAFITFELKKRNEELDKERLRAVRAERAKSTFLAHMSHELRTPLNAIQGMSQVMTRGDLGPLEHPKYLSYAADISSSADHLLSLINDILDISKIDAGKFEIRESNIDLSTMIHNVVRIAATWPNALNVKIRAQVSQRELTIFADRRAIHQVLLNLTSNAVKFTPPGGSVFVTCDINKTGDVVISVSDTGCGIPALDLPFISEPFSQSRRRSDIYQEGTGLGLNLVKSMTGLHGGTFEITSKEDVGTVVYVTLPAARVVSLTKKDTPDSNSSVKITQIKSMH